MTWLDELDRRTLAAADNGQYDEPVWDDHPDDPVFIHWPDLWNDDDPTEWLYEPVLAQGRGHAIYAGHKQGKSLFVFWICTQLAAQGDTDIIYLDYEMTRDDLRERLEDMGYGPDSPLDRIHYALLPSLPPLDTGEGATALHTLIDSIDTDGRQILVIIDTTSRGVQGDENSADTFREFYRWTGISLKRRGITWVRLDHAGKDALKGQRGSSGKGDDVDIIWRLTAADDGITLHRDAARMAWVPDTTRYAMTHDPLGYTSGAELWPAGTKALAQALDELDAPLDITRRQARELMRQHGLTGENSVLGKALKYLRTTLRTTILDDPTDQTTDQTLKNPVTRADQPTDHPGPTSRGESGPVSVTSNGPTGTPVHTPPTYEPSPDSYELTRTCRNCDQPATDISGLCPTCLNPGTLPPLDREELF